MSNEPKTTPFNDIQKDGVIVLPWLDGMELGGGYDSLTLVPKGKPYDADKTDLTLKPTSGSSSQSFLQDIRRIESTSQLNNALAISASVNASYGLFSASASSTFQKSTEINQYSLYFLINAFVRNSEEKIKSYALSQTALNEDGDVFRGKYGDYFVSGVVTGGTLYSLLTLTTNSRETKEEITASLEAKYSGGFSIGGKFSTDISKALKTSGVNFSSSFQANGASPAWNSSAQHNNVDEILESAKTFPNGVAQGGMPMFAILTPYDLLQQAPQTSSSINGQALDAIRAALTDTYLVAKQILDSADYALSNPQQFPPDDMKNLPEVKQQMVQVMQDIIKANSQLIKDPTKPIKVPEMPSMSLIPSASGVGR